MMQASLGTCRMFATGLHKVGTGICALLEMHAETVQKWTSQIQWKHQSQFTVKDREAFDTKKQYQEQLKKEKSSDN